MPVEHFCTSCSQTFTSFLRLRSHARATRHIPNPFICEKCNLSFSSLMALQSHVNSSKHLYDYSSIHPTFLDVRDGGYTHSDGFLGDDDDDDPYCNVCERQFANITALNKHLVNSPKHNLCNVGQDDDDPRCGACRRQFSNITALNMHLAYSPKHHWCFDCSRNFKSNAVLEKHRNSLAHHERDFKCPFCESMFKSPSGIALHIESGCHKYTRHHVTAAVHSLQIVPNISIKQIEGPIRLPPMSTINVATGASFDGSAYDCFLCHKKFKALSGLNGHLNSPAHDDDEFRCPKCKAEFKLISGFVQHLESRSCGLANTTQIEMYFNDLTAQFSRLLKV